MIETDNNQTLRIIIRWCVWLVICFSFTAKANAILPKKAPDVVVSAVEIIELQEQNLHLNVYLNVHNPNNQSIPIKAIRYTMEVMGQRVAKDYRDMQLTLEPNSQRQIKMPVRLDMLQLLVIAPDALLANKVVYKLSGAVAIEGLVLHLPFEKRGELVLYE